MACGPCQAKAALNQEQSGGNSVPQQNKKTVGQPCMITKELLQTWQTILKCVKARNKQAVVGLAVASTNQILGILQSALNYPDNYCYYSQQLANFQNSILPLIVNNVPECIS